LKDLFYTILIKSFEHLELAFLALFIAMIIAIPLGIILAKSNLKCLSSATIRGFSVIQTIPGLALIALIIVFLTCIRPIFPLPTTGFLPAIIILVLYAISPLLSNTYTGIKQVPNTMIEVAQAMGMKSKQVLFWVEIPLSLPVILAGIKLALVWTIGMVTLTSLVGSGGLGDLIIQGLRTMQISLVLAGTVPAAIMAILFDMLFDRLGKWLVPYQSLM